MYRAPSRGESAAALLFAFLLLATSAAAESNTPDQSPVVAIGNAGAQESDDLLSRTGISYEFSLTSEYFGSLGGTGTGRDGWKPPCASIYPGCGWAADRSS